MHIFAALTFPLRSYVTMNLPSWKAVGLHTGDVLELGLGSLNISVASQFCALLSHFLTAYHLVTVVDSCCITRSHVSSLSLHFITGSVSEFKLYMYVKMQLIQFPWTCAMPFLFQVKQHLEKKTEIWRETETERERERETERRLFCRHQIQLLLLKTGIKSSLWKFLFAGLNLFMQSIVPTVLVVMSRFLERDPSASGPCGAALFLDSLMPSSIRLYD